MRCRFKRYSWKSEVWHGSCISLSPQPHTSPKDAAAEVRITATGSPNAVAGQPPGREILTTPISTGHEPTPGSWPVLFWHWQHSRYNSGNTLSAVMQASFIVASPGVKLPEFPSASQQAVETADLLRQLLDVQREQLAFQRNLAMNNDAVARSRRFLEKWQDEFPEIAGVTKTVLPAVERMYLRMIEELTDKLSDEADELENEYVLGEFLDKYGARLNQLSTIINNLSPIADAAVVPQPTTPDEPKS